jgi:hypothetical protein
MRAAIASLGFLCLFLTQGCATYNLWKVGEGWDHENVETLHASVVVAEREHHRTNRTLSVEVGDQHWVSYMCESEGRQTLGTWTLTVVEGELADRALEAARADGALRPADDVVHVYAEHRVYPPGALDRGQTIALVSSPDEHAFLIESRDGWRRVKADRFEQHHYYVLKTVGKWLALCPLLVAAGTLDVAFFWVSVPALWMQGMAAYGKC